jgi:hypothetical protein
MKVLVYVEGPSDVGSMEELLRPLIAQKLKEGIQIRFIVAPGGDKKKSVLLTVPQQAARIIANDPTAIVIAMPDLYPRNKAFTHETFEELRDGIQKIFINSLRGLGLADNRQYSERFQVFCFKYELEALVLAATEALKLRLDIDDLPVTWITPVEDQNHGHPPKQIVQELFKQHDQKYIETIDSQLILGISDYHQIARDCQQCFGPFVKFLQELNP